MERRRAAGALLALAACILSTAAAPTASNHTSLDLYDGEPEGCYYNFQHYGEGDRIMTNEPCLNCTCHNRMLMCYLRVCPFTKPIGQDCTVEKRADQCCPIVTCPDVPVDLLTLTSTTSPAEYGSTGIGKLDKYGCSINGKYFSEGSKVPSTPNKPCEHCYCIRNMTTCVMQECTLHVDGCTPIYHKDVCCPVRYSCDHPEDEILLLDDKTTTVRPTPGFLLTTTTNSPVTQFTQDCVHDDQIFSDGAFIKTEKACEHCYCMKGDIVCVVQECGTPMENEGKNCTSLPPREGQCCPDTYICEGDELNTGYPTDLTTELLVEDITTLSPPRRVGVEGSGYRKEPDNIEEPHSIESTHEGSGDLHESGQTVDTNDVFTTEDNTKYMFSTIPAIENVEKEESEKATPVNPSVETTISTDIHVASDEVKATTIVEKEQDATDEETVEHDKTESSTSPMPTYDHKLETSPPEVQSITDNEIDVHEDKGILTTIISTLEQKEATTVNPIVENVVTDTVTIEHNKYIPTTILSILEDEGITTESDREQQTISSGSVDEHSFEPGLHMASTTSAPFLEEVEGIPTGNYGQNVVTDGITESVVYDTAKDKTEAITTPAAQDNDNLIDINKVKDVEPHGIPEQASPELTLSTTNQPILEEVEKMSTSFPVDLITSKSPEEIHESDEVLPISTTRPISVVNEEAITESIKESPTPSRIPESSDSQQLDTEIEKSQTEKYDQVTDGKTFEDQTDISPTASAPVIDDKDDETIKTNVETVSTESVGTEIADTDKHVTIPIGVPLYDDDLSTVEHKDTHKPQIQDISSTTPEYVIEYSEKATTEETSYSVSTEKIFEQETPDLLKPSPTGASITEEVEMATTEYIKDQDYVTTSLVEQENLKPGEYVTSTSSTPFLEEIEKLTTEISQSNVVTDVITEKEHAKPSKPITSATETSLSLEGADSTEPDKDLNTIPSEVAAEEESSGIPTREHTTVATDLKENDVTNPDQETSHKEIHAADITSTSASPTLVDSSVTDEKVIVTTEPTSRKEDEQHIESESPEKPELPTDITDDIYLTTESPDRQETKITSEPSSGESQGIHEPLQELTTETSRIGETIPQKDTKLDDEHTVSLTTQISPTLPEITTIDLGENEINEDNVLPPGRIPGEGDCLLDGVTYRNESVVPNTNKCHSDCRCVSSIIKCSPIICSSPPEYMDNCQPTYDSPDSCCPTYVCDQLRETLPPMPHIQITTELPQQPSAPECRGDQCTIEEGTIQPAVSSEACAYKDCESETDKKTDISSCGPHGCTETSSTPELCADGICIPTTDECSNGDCKHSATPSSEPQCEDENCESSPVKLPQGPDCANGICEDHKEPIIPVPMPCTEEGGCKETDTNIVQDCADETCRRKETSDVEAKPSPCFGSGCEQQTIIQVPIETSTLGEIIEIKTEYPEHHVSDKATTEKTIHHTTTQEKQDDATKVNDYDTAISIETTQQTLQASEFDPHKELTYPEIQEPKLPESISLDKEYSTDPHATSPTLDNENDILSTRIPADDVTESHVSESDLSEYTKPSQSIPDYEEHTIKVVADEEIPMKHLTTVGFEEVFVTTSKPEISESENDITEQPEHSISDVTEEHYTESQELTTSSVMSAVEHKEHTQVPLSTISKSDDVTIQPVVETVEEITTNYQSVPKATTLAPTEKYTTLKESDEEATETEIQKGENEMYTESHISATEQTVSLESSTKEDIENDLPDVTTVSEKLALPTESSRVTTEKDLNLTDKGTYLTEGSDSPTTEKYQKPEKPIVTDIEVPEAPITETAYATSEPTIKEHEVYTEHELQGDLPDAESATKSEQEKHDDLTPPTIVNIDVTTQRVIPDQEVTESSISHKTEGEMLATISSHDVSTEMPEVLATTDLDQITEKPYEIKEQPTQTETQSHDTKIETDYATEHVTMPEKATQSPEILSHKKEPSSEVPIESESDTEKSIVSEDIPTIKEEEPSTEKVLMTVTIESEVQTEKPATLSLGESQPTILKDKTDMGIIKAKPDEPVVVSQETSTEDAYVTVDLEKSTVHAESSTVQPEYHETEEHLSVNAESTTILIPIQKEPAPHLPEVAGVTDKYDLVDDVDNIETSTDKEAHEYTTPQSYVPETQKKEITTHTEKVQTISSDSTTISIEAFTNEQLQTLSPGIDQVVTDKTMNVEEGEIPGIIETTGVSIEDINKDDKITTESPGHYSVAEDLGTKIEDGVTEHESVTDFPEIPVSTSSDQYPKVPDSILESAVTESEDISKVSDEVQTTEVQTPFTEFEHPLGTELPGEEELVKVSEKEPATDAPKPPTEISKTQDEHSASPDLQAATTETLITDSEEATLSSVAPHVTDIDVVDVTESVHKITSIPESSSIKSEEASSSILHDDLSEHTDHSITSAPLTEEPVKASSPISDSAKLDHDDIATETPEIVTNVDSITPLDESHTVPQETGTETIGIEITTKSAVQEASVSHDKNEVTEPASVPMYELPETTPYLIEVQEHTHKNIQEITTISSIEQEITTEQGVSGEIEKEHGIPESSTESIVDTQTESQEPQKHSEETVTSHEIVHKSTEPNIIKDEETFLTTESAKIDEHHDQDITTISTIKQTDVEKESTSESAITDDVEKTITTSEKPIQSDFTIEITTPEEIQTLSTEKSTTVIAEELPTQAPVAVDKFTKPDEKPIELPSPLPDLSKPSNIQPTDEVPSPDEESHFPPSGSNIYGNEPDYVEEDQAFGPGTCRYGGKVYVSAQQIPRDDPCDFCFCFRSDIICLQQSCPPPIHGCHEEPIQGFCCPRYECPVSMATTLNVTTTTTTTTTTLPPHFPTHSYKGAAQRRGCQIKGHTYKVGEVVRGSSGPCLHCTCGGDGQMKCDPKACTPEPMLRQMIAAAVSAKRRR